MTSGEWCDLLGRAAVDLLLVMVPGGCEDDEDAYVTSFPLVCMKLLNYLSLWRIGFATVDNEKRNTTYVHFLATPSHHHHPHIFPIHHYTHQDTIHVPASQPHAPHCPPFTLTCTPTHLNDPCTEPSTP
ncbi:hypothetical protein E2C01_024720 [Portunus trituberculatus]|uniref:Uncharacterized protein n=1 Tax=Portunus trituberculatus TaxID=210409 RepID=A0A5B7EBJ1_PORTR|nr:hypothetical protein [Portunus trituberculatus]